MATMTASRRRSAAGLTVAAAHGHLAARAMTVCTLALLALGSLAYFFASFPAGMTLADTFMTDGADHSPWGNLLHVISQASFGTLLVLGVVSALGRLRRTAGPAASATGDHRIP